MIQPVPVGALPASSETVRRALPALTAAVGGRLSTTDQDRISYARDMWPLALIWMREGRIPPPPDAVVWPKSAAEVAAVIQVARQHKVPVIPFGAGSGVCGGTWALRGGVALDMKRMEGVGAVDQQSREVTVQTGVIGEVLERRLSEQGFTLGHFPLSMHMSTLGGWLAARSAGQLSCRYGKIEDMVVSVSGVFGTGEPFTTARRGRGGPELAQLLIGSEGVLCAFTEATLRVHPQPEQRAYRAFRVRSVDDGLSLIRGVLREGLRPAVIRLHDPLETATLTSDKKDVPTPPSLRSLFTKETLPALARRLSPLTVGRPALVNRAAGVMKECLLILVFEGERNRVISEERAAARRCLDAGARDLGDAPARRWFEDRYATVFSSSKIFDNGAFADSMEVACSWDKAMDVYERVRAAVSTLAVIRVHFSHAYLDGISLHFSFVAADPAERPSEARYANLWRVALEAAVNAGANVSHQHGVGAQKVQTFRDALGDGRRALVALKRSFDPDGIMNPGKLSL